MIKSFQYLLYFSFLNKLVHSNSNDTKIYYYGIEIRLANNTDSIIGSFKLDLEGSMGKAVGIKVPETFLTFEPGETYTYLLASEKNFGLLERVTMEWTFPEKDILNPLKLTSDFKIIIDQFFVHYFISNNSRILKDESTVLCPEHSDQISSDHQFSFVSCSDDQGDIIQGRNSRYRYRYRYRYSYRTRYVSLWFESRRPHLYLTYRPPRQGANDEQTFEALPKYHGSNYGAAYGRYRKQYTSSTIPSYSTNSNYQSTSTYPIIENDESTVDYHTTPSYHSSIDGSQTTSMYELPSKSNTTPKYQPSSILSFLFQ